MSLQVENIIGPRIPRSQLPRPRYVIPTALLMVAAAMLVMSFFLPYWKMTLHAPQYPKGLHVQAYLNRLTGDVGEIDGLNHYIGMRPLNEAAKMERETSVMLIAAIAMLIISATFIHNRWAALVALPAVIFPVGFLLDLYFWLNNFGQNLDPHAALSNSVKPFTPPVLGTGMIGQFKTVAEADRGLMLAACSSLVILAALYFHRRAYKPLVDARRGFNDAPTDSKAAEEQEAMAA